MNNTISNTGGSKAKAGIYWSKGSWDLVTLSGKGGVLPGGTDTRYVRIPVLAMIVFAPLMGASYVVFLPFIGFAMFGDFLAKKAGVGIQNGVTHLAMVLSPEWRPGEAYFMGRRKKAAKGNESASADANEKLEKLEKEIETKREGKK
jgi:K+-transporting ATPase c subunit